MPPFFDTFSDKSLLAQGTKYKILYSFKQDSCKQIFKALREDKKTGVQQEVLLKIFYGEKKSYREEFESLSQVVSPYCVRLFGFENFGQKRALVLEYIRGISLFQLLENFSLDRAEIYHILSSIYKGLEDLSEQGFCHGDLSLDNVLIDEKANIKLIDFGKANYEQSTQGTPPFLAPELLKGTRANFLSDLYSLGLIEFLLKNPFPLHSLKDIKPEDFDKKSPLLSFDPLKRCFPYKEETFYDLSSALRSLSYKVKDILSFIESKHSPTLKYPQNKFSDLWLFPKKAFLFFLLVFAGMVGSQPSLSSYGWISIYTHQWFAFQMGSFKAYSPLKIPVQTGWHSIKWQNQKDQGKTRIFVSKGKSVILNDKSFLHEEQ